jgi:hypothetical protein
MVIEKLCAIRGIFFWTHVLLVSILESTPTHTSLKCMCQFKMSNRVRWAYLTQVASQCVHVPMLHARWTWWEAFHDVCGPMWSLFLIEHLYNLSGIRQVFKLRMGTKRTCLIMTLCLKYISYSSFNGRSSMITSKKEMKKKTFWFLISYNFCILTLILKLGMTN